MSSIKTTGNVWKYPSDTAAWYFLTLDDTAREVVKTRKRKRPGWGQVKVRVKFGGSQWDTSVFPDKKHGYLLPLKAKIRNKEGIENGDTITVTLTFL